MKTRLNNKCQTRHSPPADAFTRVDLTATVSLLMALSLVFGPSFARGSLSATGTSCIDKQRLLTSAWQQYAADHSDRLVNNFTLADTQGTINNGQFDTWALNILDWSTAQSNTNRSYIQNGKLFPYLQGNTQSLKCPADLSVSSAQRAAGWNGRIRSYSMNGFMGKTSVNDSATTDGRNFLVPGKRQFLKTASIPNPANTIVFLDEHPDSVNDGFFIQFPPQLQWADLPASVHNGGCGFGFADGRAEIHTWQYNATKVPVRYSFPMPPPVSPSTSGDLLWLTSRMAFDPTTLAMKQTANGLQIAWSALTTNYVLEATSDLSTPAWTPVQPQPITDYGTKTATTDASNSSSFFRLRRY